ncbi:pyruvate dehydrogenase (acetyl-transferring) kinase, mitochondrial-like isoform X3 [Magnolia sinica]|uniref:pyruvate dehydrogenase (acetyl-transferring) kinase, mitochondrial-like isoform X3 n=1 Tax=Magnolia sinica TaxID=86752 RepID=UPI0026591E8B|nr:pyruvate dehydrogenase (acetyl-transferring) kinase, mitochondrial-like isoform X3 [Magnolia sinica]
MAARKASEPLSKAIVEEVWKWGGMKPTGVTLRCMMDFGSIPTEKSLLLSAQFLHKELAIRIARRAIELENLPYGLSQKPAVLKIIRVRHKNVVPTMALGIQQLKKDLNPEKEPEEIHQFLDRFYMSRIGIRMLIGQHVALHDPHPQPGCVGQIHCQMSPMQVALNASEDARTICMREYGSAPDVKIFGDPNFSFPYVPSHLHLMVFELVKNSLRAVQERFMDSDKHVPDVRIIVADGIEDVTIKISDEGGGIARSGLRKIFTYLYSTAKNPLDEQSYPGGETDLVTMAGFGYGIPISRLYARYFGGDLQIISMEGYGTDAYLHLSRLGDSQEALP